MKSLLVFEKITQELQKAIPVCMDIRAIFEIFGS